MRLYGLTGNTGTGKSTVAHRLVELGYDVIDADQIARFIVTPGQNALEQIVETFGSSYVNSRGELLRKKLGELVFRDPEKMELLENITHPEIAAVAEEKIQRYREAGSPVVFYDSAILVETGAHKGMDGLVVVSSTRRQQIQRIIARDGLSESAAAQRVDSQLPMDRKIQLADYIINNSGTLEQLMAEVDQFIAWLDQLSQ